MSCLAQKQSKFWTAASLVVLGDIKKAVMTEISPPAGLCTRQSAHDEVAEIWGLLLILFPFSRNLGAKRAQLVSYWCGDGVYMRHVNLAGCAPVKELWQEQQVQSWVQVTVVMYGKVQVLVCLPSSFSSAVQSLAPCPTVDKQCSYCAVPFLRCSQGRGICFPKILDNRQLWASKSAWWWSKTTGVHRMQKLCNLLWAETEYPKRKSWCWRFWDVFQLSTVSFG